MTSTRNESHEQLIQRLTTGFGALLEQVQELAKSNTDLERRLARVREEVVAFFFSSLDFAAMTINRSSRSGAIHLAVIDTIPID